jgi:hypothetical protein
MKQTSVRYTLKITLEENQCREGVKKWEEIDSGEKKYFIVRLSVFF